ncbi:MAG TPA: co-chaperone DjlA [Steroidobacteraceae bacterium]|nr:co-chaperone DjlA [Steroidobacteraceae bacterium]
MIWYGKILGAVIGAFLTRSPIGIIVGVILGHYFDVQAMRGAARAGGSSDPRQVPEAFFRATFQTMGHIAKADGRVSEEEIRAARQIMAQFRLGEAEVRLAIDLFTEGKASEFPLNDTLQKLNYILGDRVDLRRMFVQIQLQAALWGDGLHTPARTMLNRVCEALGISQFELAQMEALMRMQRAGPTYQQSARDKLQDAYSVLGVTEQTSDAEVTKAYRRLMSQNHPDKLAAKGLPESMKTVAEEKTRQIRAAYDAIREARGMK